MHARPIKIYIPSTRGVTLEKHYGGGNLKIGLGVLTYDKLPGFFHGGTCPGSSPECEAICYAKKVVDEEGIVDEMWRRNTAISPCVPPIPDECTKLRIHVSGDFDSVEYIGNWCRRLQERPDVKVWAYTRSWRVPSLLESLEHLRAMPNMELFGSMDASIKERPPAGWRRAWILRDTARPGFPIEERLTLRLAPGGLTTTVDDGTPSYICPEETGRKPDCEACRYCFDGHKNDVTFLEH